MDEVKLTICARPVMVSEDSLMTASLRGIPQLSTPMVVLPQAYHSFEVKIHERLYSVFNMVNVQGIEHEANMAAMLKGDLYYAFTPELTAMRDRCHQACHRFNVAGDAPRERLIELWRDVIQPDAPASAIGQGDDAYIDGPIKVDYGFNLKLGKHVYINFNCVFLDTCTITIGDRTLIGPNCCFYSATHPVDPFLRNGTKGPELGKPIVVGEDCWFGGSVVVLPGIRIGKGCTIGAGSVVTKDIPDFHVAAGNPARIIRKIEVTAQ